MNLLLALKDFLYFPSTNLSLGLGDALIYLREHKSVNNGKIIMQDLFECALVCI